MHASGQRFVVIGSGGHAKVVIATIEAAGGIVAAVLDDDATAWGRTVLGHLVTGPVNAGGVPPDARVILGLGSNRARSELAARFSGRYGTVVHPTAYVHDTCVLGAGSVVFAGGVLQPDVMLGEHCIVNTQASIDHDCKIHAYAHVAPGAHLAGGVVVGEGALIGVGSALIPSVRVGAWAIVGAGAAVVDSLPDGVTVGGVPARPLNDR